MRILLTGGAGYIGSHCCVALLQAGFDVTVVDDYSNSMPEAVYRAQELGGGQIDLYEADVNDADALRKIFAQKPIDGVIHLAGYKAVGESVFKPLEYYRNNLGSTLTLLQVMKEMDVRTLVFSSSATVYGDNPTMPLQEDQPLGMCASPYGWTKWMNEQILRDAAVADPTLQIVTLRYFNPVGAHESGRIGEDPDGIPNNLMPRITQAALGKLDGFTVFGDDYPTPDGTCIRDYIHVVDLAEGHVAALKYAFAHPGVEHVNLGCGHGSSVKEVIDAFRAVTGQPLPYQVAPRRAGDLPVSYADAEKAQRLLGWRAKRTLAQMCEDAWRWQQDNPKGYRE